MDYSDWAQILIRFWVNFISTWSLSSLIRSLGLSLHSAQPWLALKFKKWLVIQPNLSPSESDQSLIKLLGVHSELVGECKDLLCAPTVETHKFEVFFSWEIVILYHLPVAFLLCIYKHLQTCFLHCGRQFGVKGYDIQVCQFSSSYGSHGHWQFWMAIYFLTPRGMLTMWIDSVIDPSHNFVFARTMWALSRSCVPSAAAIASLPQQFFACLWKLLVDFALLVSKNWQTLCPFFPLHLPAAHSNT